MAILDRMCLALWASPPPPWCNPRKGRDQILQSGNHEPNGRGMMAGPHCTAARAHEGIEGRSSASGDGREEDLANFSRYRHFPLARSVSSVPSILCEESLLSHPVSSSVICQDKGAIMVFVWTTLGNDIARKLDFNVKGGGGGGGEETE